MEPMIISTIAASAVSLIAPYLKMAAEGLVKKAGEEIGKVAAVNAWNKAQEISEIVRTKFMNKEAAREALTDLAENPDDSDIQAAVRVQLKKFMQEDEVFAKQLADLLKDAAEANADTVFNTNVYGDVQKLVQMGNVYGDVTI